MVWTRSTIRSITRGFPRCARPFPIVVLLGGLAFFRIAAHWAAILGLLSALLIAIFVYGMPASMAGWLRC